jgi:hypothetical protein
MFKTAHGLSPAGGEVVFGLANGHQKVPLNRCGGTKFANEKIGWAAWTRTVLLLSTGSHHVLPPLQGRRCDSARASDQRRSGGSSCVKVASTLAFRTASIADTSNLTTIG